ncbi:uncharacterized protein [Ptychodera flava]|uniref:uncharacterized protein n=1 Tax=Ptychodera flava TaxID=63121 RepID=UPI00396A4C05
MVACRPAASRIIVFVSMVVLLENTRRFSNGAAIKPANQLTQGNVTSGYGSLIIFPDSSIATVMYEWLANHHGNYAGIFFTSSKRDLCREVAELKVQPISLPGSHGNHSQTEETIPCSTGSDAHGNAGFLVTFGSSVGFRLLLTLRPNDGRSDDISPQAVRMLWMTWSNVDNVTCNGTICAAPGSLNGQGYVCIDDNWQCDIRQLGKCVHSRKCEDGDDEVDEELTTTTILKYCGVGVAAIVMCMCCWFCVRTGVQDVGNHGHTLGMFSIVWVRNSLIRGTGNNKQTRNKSPAKNFKRDSFNRANFQKAKFDELSDRI